MNIEEAVLFTITMIAGYFLARAFGMLAHLRRRANQPRRCRVYRSHTLDSTVWDGFVPRDDDIFIVTAYRAGAAHVQQIVAALLGEQQGGGPASSGPWIDFATLPREQALAALEAHTCRRCIAVHLPATAMPYYPKAKYIYVGCDARDAFMSLCDDYSSATADDFAALNGRAGRGGPPLPAYDSETMSPSALFGRWLGSGWEMHPWEMDGYPFWSLFYNFDTWCAARRVLRCCGPPRAVSAPSPAPAQAAPPPPPGAALPPQVGVPPPGQPPVRARRPAGQGAARAGGPHRRLRRRARWRGAARAVQAHRSAGRGQRPLEGLAERRAARAVRGGRQGEADAGRSRLAGHGRAARAAQQMTCKGPHTVPT